MGQKVNPISFRTGVILEWKSCWYANKDLYGQYVVDDYYIRDKIKRDFADADIVNIYINKLLNKIEIYVFCNNPNIIIGENGEKVNKLSDVISKKLNKDVYINIKKQINKVNSSALTVSYIIQQIENRKPYKKVIKQAMSNVMGNRLSNGIKIYVSGRLNGAEIARGEQFRLGSIPLNSIKTNIDYYCGVAKTEYGTIGVKVWIYNIDSSKTSNSLYRIFEAENKEGKQKEYKNKNVNFKKNNKNFNTTNK